MARLWPLVRVRAATPMAHVALFERHWRQMTMLLMLAAALNVAAAQVAPALPKPEDKAMSESEVADWLKRLHGASRDRNYVGTFVVSSASGALASARIWHACEGEQQVERVETLTGAPRSVFRHNDRVVTFLPDQKVARTERRESLGAFPGLLKSLDATITDLYSAKPADSGRVAGFDAQVVQLTPKDKLRFGYRVWSDRQTSLVLKVQTLDTDGHVLEQAAFSELHYDEPVRIDQLEKMMAATDGWKVETPVMVKTTAQALGWTLSSPVAGFNPVNCYQRALGGQAAADHAGAAPDNAMHWVFSDGLASVSLFVEPFDSARHGQPGQMVMGATHTVTLRLSGGERGNGEGNWWLTAVGEVPIATLQLFGERLRRLAPTK
ncbi:MAG: MucB/RseB C-terminal domain-containing protein [Burkholderiales bacterium]